MIPGIPGPRRNARTCLTALALVAYSLWVPFGSATALEQRAGDPPIGDGVDLKILAIGDSITYGAGRPFCELDSPPVQCNGYRKPLYESLRKRGNKVEFVGKTAAGDFEENLNEGHRGERIEEIQELSRTGIWAAPNIVLLHAGTNDVKDQKADYYKAHAQLRDMISLIYEKSPDALVFLCKIIPANPKNYHDTAAEIPNFNSGLIDIESHFKARSKKIVLVDMNSELDPGDLSDGLHPTTDGYGKMAAKFLEEIEKAQDDISKPIKGSKPPPSSTSPSNCRATPSWYKVGKIADGAKVAKPDGDFVQMWDEMEVLTDGFCKRDRVRFMDLDGDGLKDYACVDPDTGKTTVRKNKGKDGKMSTEWGEEEQVATGAKGRKGSGVMFADLNGDGRDDYIYVDYRNGYVHGWINQGKPEKEYLWENLGVIASGVLATSKALQMVDLDGDGRDDFCLVNPDTGEVQGWLNTGVEKVPDYYRFDDLIATGSSKGQDDKVILGDFTGEGRADYMLVDKDSKVTGFINRLQPHSVAPRWSLPVTVAKGRDDIDINSVRMVDMNGDGKVDYIALGGKGKISYWRNKSSGGRSQPGEGVFLCDLDGNGVMDYFWVDDGGKGWGYLNVGKGKNQWYDLGAIATTGGHERHKIRMAVLTRSGRADYVVVNDDDGSAEWWQNLGSAYDYNWAHRGVAAAGPKETLKRLFDWDVKGENVRFADLDDDGLDDYVYVNEDGAVAYFKNTGVAGADRNPEWGLAHLVADGVGVAPRDLQFANTDGEGAVDYVVVGRITGKATTWHNLGFRTDGSQSIRWNTPLPFADGTDPVNPGHTIQLADMTGDGRADYVAIDPDTGSLTLWQNRCWETGDGDDGDGGGGGGGDDGPDPDKKPWDDRSHWEWCNITDQKGFSQEQKTYVWGSEGKGLGVGQWLDEQISGFDGEDQWEKQIDWLNTLVGHHKNINNSEAWNHWECKDIYDNTNCISNSFDCTDFYDADLPQLYWIAEATASLNSYVMGMALRLSDTTLKNRLEIDTMIKYFGKPDEDTQAFDILITSMGIAGTITGSVPLVSGSISGLSSFLTLMSQLGPSDEANNDIVAEGALGMLFTSSMRGLRSLLRLSITGIYEDKTDPTQGEGDIVDNKKPRLNASSLPDLGASSYKTNIAKFFRDGRWLLDSSKMPDVLDDWAEDYGLKARQSIATALVRSQGWLVFIDVALDTKEKCSTESTDAEGRRWIASKNMCADLWVWYDDITMSIFPVHMRAKSKFDDIQNENITNIDLADLYSNAINCAMDYPDGDGQASTTDFEFVTGQFPSCFFNFPVIRGKLEDVGSSETQPSPPDDEPFINTSDRGNEYW